MADQHAQSGEDHRPTEIPAIRWEEPPEGPVLVLLDQTRLPAEEVELVCTDASALVEAIRSLAVRGAPLLGIAGAYGVALAAARGFDVDEAATVLAGARPTAVNLGVGVRRARSAHRAEFAKSGDSELAARAALDAARRLHQEDAEASARMAERGWHCWTSCCPGAGTGFSRTATPARWCLAARGRRSRWPSRRTGRGSCEGSGWTKRVRCCKVLA